MEVFNKKLADFFTENTLWIFLTLLLFSSYLLMASVMKDSWMIFMEVFLKLCIIYSPVLLFVCLRKTLLAKLPFKLVAAIWSLCMIGWLIILPLNSEMVMDFIIQENQYSYKIPKYYIFATSFLGTICGAVLLTELVLLSQDYFNEKLKTKIWTQNISVDKMLLIVVLLLSIFLAVIGTFRVANNGEYIGLTSWIILVVKFISFAFQFLIINLLYYFYYYINKQILIPRLLKEKGIIFYGFSVAAVVLVFYPIFIMLIRHLPVTADLGLEFFLPDGQSKTFSTDGGGFPFLIIFLSLPVIISNDWFRQNNEIVNLEKEKSATELNLLKQQINPHFFFNTLNNLYALSITKDKQTPEVILQLSELMRYVIYKGKEDLVSLKEEVKYIEDYIQLQQIRLHKKLDFKFDKNIFDDEQAIPPLLFITFVENAFKHGIEPAEGNCYLYLNLTSDHTGLTFSCKNSIEEIPIGETGIGLNNLKRRMELRYPGNHSLETIANKTDFSANLKLNFK